MKKLIDMLKLFLSYFIPTQKNINYKIIDALIFLFETWRTKIIKSSLSNIWEFLLFSLLFQNLTFPLESIRVSRVSVS
jgi:hypothetical protein